MKLFIYFSLISVTSLTYSLSETPSFESYEFIKSPSAEVEGVNAANIDHSFDIARQYASSGLSLDDKIQAYLLTFGPELNDGRSCPTDFETLDTETKEQILKEYQKIHRSDLEE